MALFTTAVADEMLLRSLCKITQYLVVGQSGRSVIFLVTIFFCASTNYWSKGWLDTASKAFSFVFGYLSVPNEKSVSKVCNSDPYFR
jgi:hypothetical protein